MSASPTGRPGPAPGTAAPQMPAPAGMTTRPPRHEGPNGPEDAHHTSESRPPAAHVTAPTPHARLGNPPPERLNGNATAQMHERPHVAPPQSRTFHAPDQQRAPEVHAEAPHRTPPPQAAEIRAPQPQPRAPEFRPPQPPQEAHHNAQPHPQGNHGEGHRETEHR